MLLRMLLIRFLIAFFILLACPARGADLVLILSNRGELFSEFGDHFRRQLDGSGWRIKAVVAASELTEQPALREADAWVAVGAEAFRNALQQPQAPGIVATLLSRFAYERIHTSAPRVRPTSGFVLDQPASRQLHFIQQLLPGKKRIGILAGAESQPFLNQLAAHGDSASLDIEETPDDASVVPLANRLLPRVDVLLAQPDVTIYSRNNLRPILLASFRFQRPVIGFSGAFAQAGALAALFTSPQQAASQLAEWLGSGRKLPAGAIYPDRFSVAYNRQVARALGLDLPDESTVLRALEKRRNDP